MAEWLNGQLKQLGVDTKLVDLGRHTMDGEDLPLPPAILGRIGNDSNKKTVLIYGHFDVQPVNNFQLLTSGSKVIDDILVGEQIRWMGHRAFHTYHQRNDWAAHRSGKHGRQRSDPWMAQRITIPSREEPSSPR